MTRIAIAALTDPGMKRKENQDSHTFHVPPDGSAHPKGILMAIADGMGGHSGGSIASKTAIDSLQEAYYADPSDQISEALDRGFQHANRQVIQKSLDDKTLHGLGSTMIAVVFQGNHMYYANVGDSRGYLVFNHQIKQFTEDHSYVASLLKAGVINEEEAQNHPEGNVITRAIGARKKLEVDVSVQPLPLAQGQYVLICCDGLYRVVSDEIMLKIIYELKQPVPICKKLIETANANGGPDNITVMIARIDCISSSLRNLVSRIKGVLG